MKGDRRTEGLELASALIPKAQFEAFFKQFEQDEPASEIDEQQAWSSRQR